MALFDLLANNLSLLVACIFLLGLLVGSFLNVVIHRLPLMMHREWQQQCHDLIGSTAPEQTPLTLSKPRSRCPHCGHLITALENIPVISYLILHGQCRGCHASISKRYPLIELLTGVLSAMVAFHFGWGMALTGALLVTWALIALSFIDIDEQLLPDNITLPLVWLGLFYNLFGTFTSLQNAVIGAISGYLVLWAVFHLFKLLTGKEGMGYGDFKLLAVFGAWLGWQVLPMIILLSSFVGAAMGILLIALKRHQQGVPIPFGPYLAVAGWIALFWGHDLTQNYLQWSGLY